MTRSTGRTRRLLTAGLTLLTGLGAAAVVAAAPAAATGVSLSVTTTADIPTSQGACGNSSITTAPSPLSLREATCLANNLGGRVTINIPSGHYILTYGELRPGVGAGDVVSLNGNGAANTIIDAAGHSRVLDLDANLTGAIQNSISNLTITGGKDDTFGGAGIIGGSNLNSSADFLGLAGVTVTGNHANVANPTTTYNPGGGIQFEGGQLSISGSTISNNSAGSSQGSGVYYLANGVAPGEGLTIRDSTFSDNTSVSSSGDSSSLEGGALVVSGTPASTYSITNSTFTGNTTTANAGSGSPVGGAVYEQSGNLTVTGSTFTGNSATGGNASPAGGAIDVAGSAVATLHYNRFISNTAPTGSAVAAAPTVNATENWWGCSAGPGQAGCDTTTAAVTTSPRLVLTASASPAHVMGPNGTATLTASLTTDSSGGAVSGSNLTGAFDYLPIVFADPPGDAAVYRFDGVRTGTTQLSSGQASVSYHSNTTLGPDNDSVTFDNATVSVPIEVDESPAITSATSANFTVGTAGSSTVTTTGYPNAALTESGTLPGGLTFADQGNGTAKITGTPTSGGSYPITVTANNGYSPNTTQTLTLTVGQPPAFTSANTATFTTGGGDSVTVTTSGVPEVSTIVEHGTLPAGVTFTDSGTGTGTLSGTPAAGSGGSYTVTLTATNGVSPDATQNLTIVVDQAPQVTTNPADQTVQPGTGVTFTAAADGYPTPTVQWQRSTDGGATFTDIAGATSSTYTHTTSLSDDGSRYRAVFTNVAGTDQSTEATLRVGSAPAFTSADTGDFVTGEPCSLDITTSGAPNATLSHSGTGFPAWLTLRDNGDGTGTLIGIPPAGSGGAYSFTLTADNGFSPSASQSFTLVVGQSPTYTSADHATFTAGSAGSFTVTTAGGYPASTTLTKTGTLPAGVSFTDNGDGTATIAGTPAAGSGGSDTFAIWADNGVAVAARQVFTLTVDEPARITSADHATFSALSPGSFTVTTAAGYPSATTLTKVGTLPSGVTFADNGDGTATIAGTPNAGSGGIYTINITAGNGVGPDSTQTFTLTVNEPAHITSVNHATFSASVPDAFTVTTTGGQPSAITLTETGALPPGVTFADNGNGTATIAGTPDAATGGSYPITITASNGVLPNDTQQFTIIVNELPTFTDTASAAFAVGTAGSFTVVTQAGYPTATTLTKTGTLPDGVTFTDNGDGTATLAGIPAAGTGGTYPLTLTADNGVTEGNLAHQVQDFVLYVAEAAHITSVDHAAGVVGTAMSFTVRSIGYGGQPTVTETGALPDGIHFTDNGNGTAAIAGTPAAGTAGTYPLAVTASNGVKPDDTQAFTLTVAKVAQTITVTSADPGTGTVGGSYTPAATSDSGLPVTYSIADATTNKACSLDGTAVHFDHAGTCVVNFDQPGNGSYGAADRAQVSIAISTIVTTTRLTVPTAPSVYGQPVPATATVAAGSVVPAGTVQFSVDGTAFGAPLQIGGVGGGDGTVTRPGLGTLTPGVHTVVAAFTPADASKYASSFGTETVTVTQAATTTALTICPRTVTALVAPVAPGSGTPDGTVTFAVGGHPIGTAALVNGVATLRQPVPAGATRSVSAVYSGSADYTGSSASRSRHDPAITATVTSTRAKSRFGWYSTPVTVRFTCTVNGAPLTGSCPAPVHLTRNGAAQSVTRTVTASDGGAATVTAAGINIDQAAPTVRIAGVRNGAVYAGRAPTASCAAQDSLSGVATCTLTTHVRGGVTHVAARVVDRAGNVATTDLTYRVLGNYLAGAPLDHGAFDVRPGRTYTLVATSALRPQYYDAAVYPRRPGPADVMFHKAGHGRWTLGVTVDRAMRSHPLWNIGIKIGQHLYVVEVRIV